LADRRPISAAAFGEAGWRSVVNFDRLIEYGFIDQGSRDIARYAENAGGAGSAPHRAGVGPG
jgi:hypothetical protein